MKQGFDTTEKEIACLMANMRLLTLSSTQIIEASCNIGTYMTININGDE